MDISVPSFSDAELHVRARSVKGPAPGTLWALGTGRPLKKFKNGMNITEV